jgi:PTH1 family peptidyl-tRNA hydrolase
MTKEYMRIIIGLGNPGKEYKNTRHNAGFMVVDALAQELNLTWIYNKKFKADLAKNINTILVKPQTYMNLSGESVRAILDYYKFPSLSFYPAPCGKGLEVVSPLRTRRGAPSEAMTGRGIGSGEDEGLSKSLTVIHDDLDIDLGKYKISTDSRSGGHNGVQSIIDHLGTKNFKRIRIGIKTADKKLVPAEKFVLQRFKKEEKEIIEKIIKEIKKDART